MKNIFLVFFFKTVFLKKKLKYLTSTMYECKIYKTILQTFCNLYIKFGGDLKSSTYLSRHDGEKSYFKD
jgi:hypothetical protein